MARPPRGFISHRDQVIKALIDEIGDGRRPVGSKLPSLRVLAKRFQTGVFPVRQAMDALMEKGYVDIRQGSGAYVEDRPAMLKMANAAMVCTDASGHVFGDLTRFLCDRLNGLGLFASVLNTGRDDGIELLRRSLHSDARFMIVAAGRGFPFDLMRTKAADRKHIIATVAWESDQLLERVHRILVDHAAASRLVSKHLHTTGHRHVLLAGPDDMIARAEMWDGRGDCPPCINVQGSGFAGMWLRQGGRLTRFHCLHAEKGPACDPDQLCAIMEGLHAPDAVVGMRDVDAWDVRETLRNVCPEALGRCTFVGDADTPWSKTSHPPFTSLSWNLEQIADLTMDVIRDIETGKMFDTPFVRLLCPRLVVRGENQTHQTNRRSKI